MQGVRSQIDEVLANVRAVASDPNLDAREAQRALQNLSSRAVREKITMLMGDEAAAGRLFDQLDQASSALQLRAGVAANSRTFPRQATDQAMDAMLDTPLWRARQGQPLETSKRLVQMILNGTKSDQLAAKDRVYRELVDVLTSSPDRGADILSALRARQALSGRPGTAVTIPGANSLISQQLGEMISGRIPQ